MGIYIHIPFCLKKCPYCSFNSLESPQDDYGPYIDALLEELARRSEEFPFPSEREIESLYIGGGTPSLLPAGEIDRLIEGVRWVMPLQDDAEVTIEANPGTVDIKSLKGLRGTGINRLSLGIQSVNDRSLKTLGRIHSSMDGMAAFQSTRDAGFENIGIDLIFGLPEQTLEDWRGDVEKVIMMRPEHISLYSLMMEEGTPFYERYGAGGLSTPFEEEVVVMYRWALERFEEVGYHQYEVSNLALPGFESRHNTRYWRHGDYIGLGAGAHSYTVSPGWGRRWWNIPDPGDYIESITLNGQAVDGEEELTRDDALLEAIFLGLRRREGIEVGQFVDRFGVSPAECLPLERLKVRGLVSCDGGRLRLTEEGVILSDEVSATVQGVSSPETALCRQAGYAI